MQELNIGEWSVVAGIAFGMAILAVRLLTPRSARRQRGDDVIEAVWLFDGERLADACATARRYVDEEIDGFVWSRLMVLLSQRFEDLPASPDFLHGPGPFVRTATRGGEQAHLSFESVEGLLRVCLMQTPRAHREDALHGPVRAELDTLRLAVSRAPFPIWRLSPAGGLAWSNAALRALHKGEGGELGPFPLLPQDLAEGRSRRLPLASDGVGAPQWFDVTVVPQEGGALCYAAEVSAVVEAENAQRKFVQTLAKTFAQLSIGLAIFDRNRQLALFNPALIDLTELSVDFLSGRPNLLTFFDRLRDRSMMPEPKNYGSWRHQMADLVAAASDGNYQETWTLPSGAVYSVIGRPHPDGAIAFLIEDITAEITLTRRFRADLELSQSVLDEMDEAVAVFSADGGLTLTNRAYRELWSVDPEMGFAEPTVIDATRVWQDRCLATPLWGEIRDFVASRENRADWWAEVCLTTGERLDCRIRPLQNAVTMVVFSRRTAAHVALEPPVRGERNGRLFAEG
ncbi:PAS-domain containing protein [Albibacillus kandeliae]|uniref:PAS-domain containing protein n=1 Tax=Albibacillus kandeliae TaxID=2174228 RepID=UPI000D6954A7|nr:PAS-domain containing protein [Albibacillus kandeliae]